VHLTSSSSESVFSVPRNKTALDSHTTYNVFPRAFSHQHIGHKVATLEAELDNHRDDLRSTQNKLARAEAEQASLEAQVMNTSFH
jgi:septal ring factor EnvC (AmiA/AmiB activator)